MKKEPLSLPRVPAAAVTDPDLPEKARRLLEAAEREPRRYNSGPVGVWRSMVPSVLRGGAAAVVGAGVWWFTGEAEWYDPDAAGDSVTATDFIDRSVQDVLDAFHSGLSFVWPFAVGALVLHMALGAVDTASHNKAVRILAEARKRRVRPTELDDDARTLLARAQQAQNMVLTSSVHRFDLIDRQRNKLTFPQQEWEIAEALREYSRLVKDGPKDPRGSRAAALLGTRHKALRTGLDGIARRVLALETYAGQVAEADDRYRELKQVQRLAGSCGDVLDFVARTARDDLAVAESEGMSGQAVAAAAAFNSALDSVKDAAVIALPARR
ncbi:hypothetical protein AB0J01_38040 [Streptomyces sp. NPDC050204]|uniref:hypothetical protein n=1 Tax=Streptomyces sp. NPDC050204 TaxID=3155514 RepID=UPI0034186A87